MTISKSKIRVGISSCLLGERVRWDGEDRRDVHARTLRRYFEWVLVCPEVEAGMGVPREPVSLIGPPGKVRMRGRETNQDWTAAMLRYARRRVRRLESENLCGYLFKYRSPSCGIARVPIHTAAGEPAWHGAGLFARTFCEHFPLIPVEDEDRLKHAAIRKNFMLRVFSYSRLRAFLKTRYSSQRLRDFHKKNVKLIASHSVRHAAALAQLIAHAKRLSPPILKQRYGALFMEALSPKMS